MSNKMKCIYQVPGNPACKSCVIKKNLNEDRETINNTVANAIGVSVELKPGNGWLSIPGKRIVTCNARKEISVC